MGASFSSLTDGSSQSAGPGLGDIPESCVASVFLYLTPPEICNLARLNRAFRGAASSDTVWAPKLPSNYQIILQLLRHLDTDENLSKKDAFIRLSRPLPFHGDKLVWLDKFTGKIHMLVSARAMAITGIDDRRYWTFIPTEESRFNEVAYLQQIWWFEVEGGVSFPFPPGIYTVSFRIHLGRTSKRLGRHVTNFEHTHGWDIRPAKFEMSTSNGQQASMECFVDDPQPEGSNGNHRHGCWTEYKVGEFIVSESDLETQVRFSMKQIDCTHSKGGLCVDAVSITPQEHRKGGI